MPAGAQDNMQNLNVISKNFYKKAFVMVSVILFLGIMILIFAVNQEFIDNFKLYYLKVYKEVFEYKFKNTETKFKNEFALILGIIEENPSINKEINLNNKAQSIPVLLYHGIIDKPDGFNTLLDDFKEQMFALKKDGWQTISIEDFYKFIRGEKELPDKSFLLTFDDGRKDSYYPVDPILKALNYRATIFIITGHSLTDRIGNYYLSKNELKRMIKSGRWDIQAHTKEGHDFYKIDTSDGKGHFYSNRLWLEDEQRIETDEEFKKRITEDFIGAKNDIKENLGIDSLSFAYPFGDFGQKSVNFPQAESVILNTIKEIYSISFYQGWPGKAFNFNYSDKNLFLVNRITVKSEWKTNDLLKVLENGRNKNLPYIDDLKNNNGWVKTWGELSLNLDNNFINLSSNASTTGSSVFLDGSYLWKNYIFKTKIDWVRGKNVSLMARFKDNFNYVSCSFDDKKIKIEQNLNGKKRIIAEKELPFEIPKENLELWVVVNNDKVECFINGDLAIYSYYLSPVLSNGGIGFKTWDPEINNSKMIVKEVDVQKIKNGENMAFMAIPEKYVETEKLVKKELDEKEEEKAIEIVVLKDNQKERDSEKEAINIVLAPKIEPEIPKKEEIQEPNSAPFPIFLPYNIKNFDDTLSWKSLWGGFAIKDNLLHIISTASTTSGFTIFENSYEWTDYLFKTKADLVKGTSFSLVARYKDPKNYVFCSFSDYGKSVSIYQVLNGETKTLGRSGVLPVSYFTPWLNLDFSIKVNGDNIECLIDGKWVLKNKIETMPKSGGIGFKIWGDKSYNNEAIIKEINVEKIY